MRYIQMLDSPIGQLTVVADETGAVTQVEFARRDPAQTIAALERAGACVRSDEGPTREAAAQLEAYFAGTRREFDLPLAPRGTPFQLRVWEELRRVPYGTTTTYGAIAERLGNPTASRAVGHANGQNPIPIIVPCHRVIGSGGALTGFGGGIDVKAALLALESGQLSWSALLTTTLT
ncbi:MAG: methylated-DNA--[protein]-cysteine S-methyltransferase [bacterium]|nr:methylated-DNA--[protein]-cysteine S-methyltransferase [bacterium]